jgi:signal transduction histidine kinase
VRSERQSRAERSKRGPARAEAAAALIFDPQQSAFVWGNAAGLMLLGVKSLARLSQDRLDRALPAAARLIAFAEAEDASPAQMSLDLWTPRGSVRLQATVERLALSRDKIGVLIRSGGVAIDRRQAEPILVGAGDPELASTELRAVEAASPGAASAPATEPGIETHCRQSVETSGEDQETLREIARLIREGELTTLPERRPLAAVAHDATGHPIEAAPASTQLASREPDERLPSTLEFDSDAMRLLAEVAHELRTPLTAVRGYGELIAAKPADRRVEDRAKHIVDAVDHALALITDILDARQIALGQAGLVFTDVDLRAEIEQAAAMVGPQAAKAGVTIAIDVASDLPKVVADARRVRQVLVNLVGNAIKFTAAAGTVRLGGGYTPEGGVEIVIADTGRGMAPAEMEAVLGERARARPHRAPGIGLPLSRALAEANGARLSIESGLGAGTTARLSFPLSCVVPP